MPRSWHRRLWSPQRVRLHGVEVVVDERLGRRSRREIYTGRYERGEAFALLARLGAGDRVVEFGTGIGLLAILAARRVGSELVTTYEPNPRLLPLISENCRLNEVEPLVIPGAVGVGRGSTILHLGDDHRSASTHGETASDAESFAVPLFDAAEEVRRFQPSFVIVDVEGCEREVVPVIDWSPVEKILLELHPQWLEPGDENRIRDHLLAEGFQVDPIVSTSRKLFLSR
ncbi:MAG TPA: FkbM family methyltransferase [Methylomirabilota bacterium]|nr:FkbM family methyltransferase [Methylomirabilota bacterium]